MFVLSSSDEIDYKMYIGICKMQQEKQEKKAEEQQHIPEEKHKADMKELTDKRERERKHSCLRFSHLERKRE